MRYEIAHTKLLVNYVVLYGLSELLIFSPVPINWSLRTSNYIPKPNKILEGFGAKFLISTSWKIVSKGKRILFKLYPNSNGNQKSFFSFSFLFLAAPLHMEFFYPTVLGGDCTWVLELQWHPWSCCATAGTPEDWVNHSPERIIRKAKAAVPFLT